MQKGLGNQLTQSLTSKIKFSKWDIKEKEIFQYRAFVYILPLRFILLKHACLLHCCEHVYALPVDFKRK